MKRKQFAFDIHPDLHKKIKERALARDISMNLWMSLAIYEYMKLEDNKDIQHETSNGTQNKKSNSRLD